MKSDDTEKDTGVDADAGGRHGPQDRAGDATRISPASRPSGSSHNLGDTQPFRPSREYRPLTSEPPLEEPDYQQTAPYRPIQQANVATGKRNIAPLILGAAALLLVAIAVTAYFIIKGMGSAGGGSLAVERVLPANTLAYISINPAPPESQRRAFATMREAFESQPGFKDAIANLVQRIQGAIGGTGLSILGTSTDPASLDTLASYLGGNMTIAVLSPSPGELLSLQGISSGEINPQTALAALDVATRNVVGVVDLDFNTGDGSKQGLIADLRAVRDNLEKAKVVEKYNDTDIRQYSTDAGQLYFSLLGGSSTAAVGIDTKPVKALIDELKSNKGLKEDASFKLLSGKVPAERMATLYVNLSEIHKSVQAVLPDFDSNSNRSLLGGFFKLNGSMLLAISGQDDGAQIDVASQGLTFDWGYLVLGSGTDGSTSLARSGSFPNAHPDSSTLNDIPTDSVAFLAGSDLNSPITSILDSLQQSAPDQLDQLEKTSQGWLGLGLREDIVPLLGGDYAISAGNSDDVKAEDVAPIVVQLKLSDADRAKAGDAIKRGMGTLYNGQAQSVEVAGGTFYSARNNSSSATLIGTTTDRALLVIDKNDGLAKAKADSVISNLGKGFGTTDKWKAVAGHLPQNSNLIGYLDATAFRETSERAITPEEKADYDKTAAPFLKPLKYILLASATEPPTVDVMSHNLTRIFIGIGK